jgi:CBS domain-containing protein
MLRDADIVAAGSLVRQLPVFVPATLTLREAAGVIDASAVGALLIRRGDELAGIVSERDIVRALAGGCDPDDARVADVMTYDVPGIGANVSAAEAALEMVANEVRHLVVYDDGDMIGVISMRDVLSTLR